MRTALALCVVAFLVTFEAGCHPTPPPNPQRYVDATDAASLLDVGASPSECALACASWAKGGCREATPNCLAVCAQASADGLYSSTMLTCVVRGDGNRAAIEGCSGGMCP